jgi:glycosyltransferase involved in cell wall biosynthesis
MVMVKAAEPLVTVVIPAFRAEGTVARAIESVQAEASVVCEIIVVVDGNVDRTAEVAASFEQVSVLMNRTNQGAPMARNRGLFRASSDYIMFLDADDYIQPPLLEALLKTIRQTDADICFGRCTDELPDGSIVDRPPLNFANRLLLIESWLARRNVPPCSTLWRRAYVAGIGGWNKRLLMYQDLDIVLRALLNGARYSWSDCGRGVCCQISRPTRISGMISHESLSSQRWVLNSVRESLEGAGYLAHKTLKAALAKQYAGTARTCFYHGYSKLGSAALDQAKNLGDWREGSLLHQGGVFILGLEHKERLAKRLHSLSKFVRRLFLRAQKNIFNAAIISRFIMPFLRVKCNSKRTAKT